MSKITIHRDDIERILKIVDKLNPADSLRLCAGKVTIHEHSKCEIGSIIDVIVPIDVDGISGQLTVSVVDEGRW